MAANTWTVLDGLGPDLRKIRPGWSRRRASSSSCWGEFGTRLIDVPGSGTKGVGLVLVDRGVVGGSSGGGFGSSVDSPKFHKDSEP